MYGVFNAANLGADAINSSIEEPKPEILPFIEPSPSNQNEIENLLDDPEFEDIECDGCIMTVNLKTGIPKPAHDEDELIKYEADIVSGNLPYAKKVRANRIIFKI